MSCCRLVSALLVGLLLSLTLAPHAYADGERQPASADEDDGASAGDVIGMLTDPQVVGAIAEAAPGAVGSVAVDGVTDVAETAALGIATSMADGAVALLEEFAGWWTSWTVIDLADSGITSPLGAALGVAMVIAWLLLVVEAGRAAYSGDGTALGNSLVGILKVTFVVAVLIPFVQALLYAADELTTWIVDTSFGDMAGLEAKLTSLFTFDPIVGAGLMFVFGLVGIVLVLLLMFEFVLRHAGILIMLCAAPIAAVGMIARPTADWWPKAAKGLLTLIMLKPVVAFIFAIAFGILGDSDGIRSLVVGMAALIAAAVAWPVIASYFTFTSIGGGGTVGAAIAGGAAGWLGGRAAGGGRPSGSAARGGSEHSLSVEREADADHAGSRAPATRPAVGAAASPAVRSGAAPVKPGHADAVAAKGSGGAGVAGALVAATAAVNAAREGINQTSAGLTDMARHADLATPHPASAGPVPVPAGSASHRGRHRRHRRPDQPPARESAPRPLSPRAATPDADDPNSEEQER